MQVVEDLEPEVTLVTAEQAEASRRRTLLWIKLAIVAMSLSLTAGVVALGVQHFSFDARDDEDRFGTRKSIRMEAAGGGLFGSDRAEDFRALPAPYGNWERTDYIGGPAVAKAFARLRERLPDADLKPVKSAYNGMNCSAALYERGGEIFMILVDRGGRELPRDLDYATWTYLGGTDFILLGRRGEANMNLLAVFDDDVSLAVVGRVEPDTVGRFMQRANLSVLGVGG